MPGTEKDIWETWEKGESRCPYCINLTCAIDWETTCDCGMAPFPGYDHTCEVCDEWKKTEATEASQRQKHGPRDFENGGLLDF